MKDLQTLISSLATFLSDQTRAQRQYPCGGISNANNVLRFPSPSSSGALWCCLAMSPSSPAGSSSSLPSSNALLAIPDGPIPSGHSDRTSHCISLIGGYPTFPALPAASKAPESIRCGVCHEAIPLLAQVYCPPEGGENDRTVYVWACPKSSCQRRDGRCVG